MRSAILAFWLSGFLAACGEGPTAPAPAPVIDAPAATIVEPSKASVDAASDAIWKEPKVRNLDYRPAETVQWIVAVDDDGSPRFGYAAYICLVLAEHGARIPDTAVRIADASLQSELGETGRDASLGAILCSDEGRLDDAPAVG